MCISSHSFQGTLHIFQGVPSLTVSTLPLLGQPSSSGSFCFTPSGEMDPPIRDESFHPGHRREGQGEGHPSPLVQADVEHCISPPPSGFHQAPLSAGKGSEERVGACLGKEVILGMDQEDFCRTHWSQKDGMLISRSHSAP